MIDEVSEVSTDSQIKYFSLPNSLENHFCLIEGEIIQLNLSTAEQIYNLHITYVTVHVNCVHRVQLYRTHRYVHLRADGSVWCEPRTEKHVRWCVSYIIRQLNKLPVM